MAVQVDGVAPYAPTKAIVSVIERHRQVGLQTIAVDVLQRMGVTESLAPRTLQALKVLDLVDDDGRPTQEFEALRRTPGPELPERLAELIRRVYAPVFEVMDPTTATVEQIGDAFRHFTPSGQRERMVALFTGLMAYAGMVEEQPKGRPGPRPQSNGSRTTRGTRGTKQTAKVDPVPPPPRLPGGEVVNVDLGTAGSITVSVDIKWLSLSDEDVATVRKAIKDLASLASDRS